MKNEEKFNRRFSRILMILMLVTITIITIFKSQDSNTKLILLLVASFGTLMGFTSALLSARGLILTFLFGILDVAACVIVTADNGAWGDFALHLFYLLPMQFVGISQWRKRGAKGTEKAVKARRLNIRQRIIIGICALAGWAITYFILLKIQQVTIPAGAVVNKPLVFFDAAVLTFNIIGQILMSLAYMEQWVIWNIVNISNLGLWGVTMVSSPESGYTVVMFVKYVFYLINSINGLRIWLRLSAPDDSQATPGCC